MDEKVLAIAEAQAAMDRDMLARLVREGRVRRFDGNPIGAAKAGFVMDIQGRAFPKREINTAIRPKRKKGKRK